MYAFNSHASISTNPCINKGTHVLLMHGLGTLSTLLSGQYMLGQLKRLSHLNMASPRNTIINENVQPHVDCEATAKYNAILFINLTEYILLIAIITAKRFSMH